MSDTITIGASGPGSSPISINCNEDGWISVYNSARSTFVHPGRQVEELIEALQKIHLRAATNRLLWMDLNRPNWRTDPGTSDDAEYLRELVEDTVP